jgi:DNA-binding transcriptional LysR family regulator
VKQHADRNGTGMNLQRIRYFVAVAEELHFTRAARRLYVDQGSLSAAIRRLEHELGLSLFDRSSRKVELTDQGRALLPYAHRLLADADAFRSAVRRQRTRDSGTLRVGLLLGPLAAAELTPLILDAFHAARPGVDLRVRPIQLHDQRTALPDGHVDVMIARPPLSRADVILHDLFTEPRLAELAPDHPLAECDEIDVEDLQGHTFVQSDPRIDRAFADWARLVDVMGPDSVRESQFRAPENVWEQHAQAAAGVTAITVASVPRLVPSAQVVHRPIRGVPGSRVAVAAPADTSNPHVATFTDIARDVTERLALDLVPGATLA